MNKYILCLAAALSLGAFTACEDVPAPYGINNNTTPETPDNPGEEGVIINAPFSTSLDGFTAINTVGEYPFAIDGSYGYVKVTSFVNPTNNAAESWLVSPTFSLKNVDKAHVTFEYILRYANANELKTNYLVRFSDNYSGNPATATWKDVTFSPIQAPDWKTWTTADVDVPAEFLGKENLVVALYYKTDQKAATWEVKNFKLSQGSASSDNGDQSVRSLPYSEAFSATMGGFKSYTTSGSGEWTIDYGTAKATGWDGSSTTAGTYYMVSPEISLEGQTTAHVSYEYILRYNKDAANQQVLISTDFNASAPTEGWAPLVTIHKEGADWQTFEKEDIAIPAEYMGKKIRIAFRYNTNSESGSTWEVKNFAIAAGAPGSTDNPSTPDTPVEDNSITVKPSSWNLDNATSVPTITLSDGTKLEFASGGNTNDPKYYTGGTNVRMYPKNTLTVTSKKKIAKIILNCDTFQGTICNASGDVSANPGSVNVDKAVITVSNINALSTILTNISSKTGAASQIRFTSITIVYAE